MILVRKFSSGDKVEVEQELDEIDFDLVSLYVKTWLADSNTYKVELKRFWTKSTPVPSATDISK